MLVCFFGSVAIQRLKLQALDTSLRDVVLFFYAANSPTTWDSAVSGEVYPPQKNYCMALDDDCWMDYRSHTCGFDVDSVLIFISHADELLVGHRGLVASADGLSVITSYFRPF